MPGLPLPFWRARAAKGCALAVVASLCALGCSSKDRGPGIDDTSDSASDDDDDDDDDTDEGASSAGSGDAGRDAGQTSTNTPKDAGRARDSAAPPPKSDSGGTGRKDPATPKELMQLDECGDGNAAGLSQADVERLKAGDKADGMGFLYPYDQTIFPRGLMAPPLMWKGSDDATAVYVHIKSMYFEYHGCLKPTAAGELQLAQTLWDNAGAQTLGASTPFTIELTTLAGKTVHGPVREEIVIAQATLKGSIYYNSYDSTLTLEQGAFGGAVLRIRPGQPAEFFLREGACTGCHALSANGERLIANEIGAGFLDGTDGQIYQLEPDSMPNLAPSRAGVQTAFAGASPDGTVYLASGTGLDVGPNLVGAGLPTTAEAQLYETDSGDAIADTGIPTSAAMPTFSPNGGLIVFNDLAQGAGTTLALMDYDASARKAANQRKLYTSSQGYPGWPFLLPDDAAVIFTQGESPNFTGNGAYIQGFALPGPKSDLMIVDAESGKATMLARAMGFATPDDAADEKTYLPFGAEELHQSYYPTVSPVAAGGYFWVFFDSIRHYGNKGMFRQLWGTAIAIQRGGGEATNADGVYGLDPSAPAFYVSGQELQGANHRAFTALDPCRDDGQSCEAGIDCCSGFCTDGVCGPPTGCSETDEACEKDDDCCNDADQCLGGFCGQVNLL